MSSVFPANFHIDNYFPLCIIVSMNQFLSQTIKQSGKTKADIARLLNITPQSIHGAVISPAPKPATIASILLACGWTIEQVQELRFGDVYEADVLTAVNGDA